jgi:hypothetical protein
MKDMIRNLRNYRIVLSMREENLKGKFVGI